MNSKTWVAFNHRHHPMPTATKELPFSGTVSRDENRSAHGNICIVERCSCGATRKTNLNGRHSEVGEWIEEEEKQ